MKVEVAYAGPEGQWLVAPHDPDLVAVVLLELLDGRQHAPAEGALEVAELDDRDQRVGRTLLRLRAGDRYLDAVDGVFFLHAGDRSSGPLGLPACVGDQRLSTVSSGRDLTHREPDGRGDDDRKDRRSFVHALSFARGPRVAQDERSRRDVARRVAGSSEVRSPIARGRVAYVLADGSPLLELRAHAAHSQGQALHQTRQQM